MGIARSGSTLLIRESLKGGFQGAILQLGRQDIYFTHESYAEQASKEGITLRTLPEITKRRNPYYPEIDTIDDHAYFRALGFDRVESVDASQFEGATFMHDMNLPVPSELFEQYDVIYDGGTLEHIFNIPMVLKNIHSMLKPGGKIIHFSPVHNFVDHGFYDFSPCLFVDYYLANDYDICTATLVGDRSPIDHADEPVLLEYVPGMLDKFSVGGLNRQVLGGADMLLLFFSAVKKTSSRGDVIPQQGFYTRAWKGGAQPNVRWPALQAERQPRPVGGKRPFLSSRVVAVISIIIGVVLLLSNLGWIAGGGSVVTRWSPVALIAIGLYFLT